MQFASSSTRRRARRQVGEINVTPMVDVMLVLLVIFMVTAPMLTVGVPVDLPQTKAKQLSDNAEPLIISVDKQGRIYLQESQTKLDALVPRLQAIAGVNPQTRIFIRGDQKVSYGLVMEVMGALNAAGYRKVALLSKMPKLPPRR